jgi:hypothetical protein
VDENWNGKIFVIDVQYKGQVVATRKGSAGALAIVDSAKVKEAFINLINRNKPDTIDAAEIKGKPGVTTTVRSENKDEKVVAAPSLADKVKREIDKANGAKKQDDKKEVNSEAKPKVESNEPKPKAVMQKKSK